MNDVKFVKVRLSHSAIDSSVCQISFEFLIGKHHSYISFMERNDELLYSIIDYIPAQYSLKDILLTVPTEEITKLTLEDNQLARRVLDRVCR